MPARRGKPTSRLRCIRPAIAHTIRGTAELALRYSIIPSASTAEPSHYQWRLRAGWGCWSMGNATASSGAAVGQFTGLRACWSSGRRCRIRSTCQGRAGRSSGRSRRSAGAAGPSRDNGLDGAADRVRRTKLEYTAARGRHDHVTFLELADASVRCAGLGVKLYLPTSDEARAGLRCSIIADLF